MNVFVAGVLFLLTAACWAQRPTIIDLETDGTITWTNPIAGGVYSIEHTVDPNFAWLPLASEVWNQANTGSVQSCSLDLSVYFNLTSPSARLNEMLRHPFFRVVTSSNEMVLPIVTNLLRIANVSDTAISNVVFGTIDNYVHSPVAIVPMISAAGTSDWVSVAEEFDFIITLTCVGAECNPSDGWYAGFTQGGMERNLEMPMATLGPPRPEIQITTRNDSVTVGWPWIEWSTTRYW